MPLFFIGAVNGKDKLLQPVWMEGATALKRILAPVLGSPKA